MSVCSLRFAIEDGHIVPGQHHHRDGGALVGGTLQVGQTFHEDQTGIHGALALLQALDVTCLDNVAQGINGIEVETSTANIISIPSTSVLLQECLLCGRAKIQTTKKIRRIRNTKGTCSKYKRKLLGTCAYFVVSGIFNEGKLFLNLSTYHTTYGNSTNSKRKK